VPKSSEKPVKAETAEAPAPRRTSSSRSHQLKVLFRISDLINSTVNNATLLRRIVRETVEAFGAVGGLIAFVNDADGKLLVEVNQGLDTKALKTGATLEPDSLAAAALEKKKVVQAPSKKTASAYEMATPLQAEGSAIGILLVRGHKPKPFSEDDERLLFAIAAQAARIIHTSRLYERLTRQTRRLETLFEIGQILISTDPLPEVLNRVTESLLTIMDVKQCTVLLVGKGHDLQLSASSGGAGTYAQRREGIDSLVEKLSARGEPVRVLDVKKLEGRRPGKLPKQERLSTLLAVPIFYQQHLVGILNVYTAEPRHFEPEEMRLLKSYASLCGVAIENARRHERLLSAAEEIRLADRASTLNALAGEVAKQVRNPLAASHLILDALHEEGVFPPGRGEDYEVLINTLTQINSIIGRVEKLGSRRTPQLEWLDVNRLVEDVIALCHHRLAARQIMIHRRFTSDLPRVLADRGEIQQIVLHCITNAMESMRHGGILNVATTPVAGPDDSGGIPMVRINVRDTGTGLESNESDDIFDPFNRENESRIGFGLFVAQKVVQKYGGRLTARNATDHGASVSITLPALEQER